MGAQAVVRNRQSAVCPILQSSVHRSAALPALLLASVHAPAERAVAFGARRLMLARHCSNEQRSWKLARCNAALSVHALPARVAALSRRLRVARHRLRSQLRVAPRRCTAAFVDRTAQ